MKIGVIGGGNMGLTYAKAFLQSRIVLPENMIILEKSIRKAEDLKKLDIGTVYGEPGPYLSDCDLIILAVKPQDVHGLFDKISQFIKADQVIMSIMAGVKSSVISASLGCKKVIRAMPNLPSQIGSGMTVFTSTDEVTRIELVMVQNLIGATGKTLYVDDENAIDGATAISGSGPAYVFYFMNSLIDKAIDMGFSPSQAELLAYQTFRGAVDLFKKHDYTCQEWIDKVSSKGGTTEAALQVFADKEVKEGFQSGLQAALDRAKELSK